MPTLRDVNAGESKALQGYRAYNSSGLVAGTNAGTIKIATVTNYTINGEWKQKAITDNIAITAGLKVQPDLTTCYYAISLDATGTVIVTQGAITVPGGPDNFQAVPGILPQEPANTALIGYMKVVTNGGTFTPGTTGLAAAGVTTTFRNCNVGPDAETF